MLFGAQNALSGMESSQKWADCVANNLANINTPAFKAQKVSFAQHLISAIGGDGKPITKDPPQTVGNGSDIFFKKDWQQGSLFETNYPFDLAVEGNGFLSIQLDDGTTAYTRGRNFKINDNGDLTTAEGYHLFPKINLGTDFQEVTITSTGDIKVRTKDDENKAVGELQVYLAPNPDSLIALEDGLFASPEPLTAGKAGEEGRGLIRQGYLEASNVDVSSALTDLIMLQKMQQFNARSMSVADNMWQMVNDLRS